MMQLGEHTWNDVKKLGTGVVVLPTGSFEQHGHHLPLLTDSLIGAEIARRAEAELQEVARFLPMLWIGASEHHRTFPGTVSLGSDIYVRVLVDILESLVAGGFRRIFLLNSHGGNIIPVNIAIYGVQLRQSDMPELDIAFSSWWEIAVLPDLVQESGNPRLRAGHQHDPQRLARSGAHDRGWRHDDRVRIRLLCSRLVATEPGRRTAQLRPDLDHRRAELSRGRDGPKWRAAHRGDRTRGGRLCARARGVARDRAAVRPGGDV